MKRIVVVDDNVMTLKRLEALLVAVGYDVVTFSGAEPALNLLSVHPANLLVLDLEMPVHSGFDLMKSLKTQGIDVPVLVVSGKKGQDSVQKAIALGASDYVLKPFDDDIFLAKVELMLKSAEGEAKPAEFAEANYTQPTMVSFVVPQIQISEMGFKFQSAFPIQKGAQMHFMADCFQEMGLGKGQFRVASYYENPEGSDLRYTIFVSFVGLSLEQLQEVRLWIRQNQLRYRRTA